jgi:hypothetical protein
MPSNAILHEATQLYSVSDRLDLLAEEHPLVSEVPHHHLGKRAQHRNLVGSAGCDLNGAPRRTRSGKCLEYAYRVLGLWDGTGRTSRGELYLEVNYGLAGRSHRSQGNLTL